MRCAFSSITCPAGPPCGTGGDIACVVETPAATRVLIGDAMGHGAFAEPTAAEVRTAFQAIAAHPDPPQVIAMRLDRFVADWNQLPDQRRRGDSQELFVTAQVISVPRVRHAEAEIVSCGHPPPLLLRGDPASQISATYLDAIPPVPPLGLLDLAASRRARASLLGAGPGDGLLLYTDGVTEAVDDLGTPYPLAERAALLAGQALVQDAVAVPGGVADDVLDTAGDARGEALVEALRSDLLAHAGGELRDDATFLYLELADESCPRRKDACLAGNMDIQYS